MTLRISPREQRDMVKELTRALAIVKSLPVATPCTACTWHENGSCARWKAPIPADAIETGCDQFDDLPF
jgi:hypothetical protein